MRTHMTRAVSALTFALVATSASATTANAAPARGDAADPRSTWLSAVSLTSMTDGWAVGNSDSFHSRPGNIAKHWEGSSWQRAKTPKVGTYGFLSGVDALSPADAWAVGSRQGMALVEHWDGSKWRVADSAVQFNSYLLSVSASGPNDAWAVGASSARFNEILEHWNGTEWTLVDGAAPDGSGLTDVEARSATNTWASGYWGSAGAYSPLMEHWDGSGWTWSRPDFGAFPNGAQVNGITSSSSKDAWVAGSYSDGAVTRPFTAHFNGKKWKAVSTPAGVEGSFSDVYLVAPDDVWAVGETGTSVLVEHWDGTAWTVVDAPSVGVESGLLGLDATGPNDVAAVGGYVTASGARKSLTLHWDGTAWSRS